MASEQVVQRIVLILLCAGLSTQLPAASIEKIVPSETVQLRNPRSISCGPDGTIYIADTGHHRIVAMTREGKLTSELGGFGSGPGSFRWPETIAAESGNAVWITDLGNRRVVKLSRLLEYRGSLEIEVDEDMGGFQPTQIAVSKQGDLYIYESDRGEILRYDPLFVLQAELGSRSGLDFIPRLRKLEFVPRAGLLWHSANDSVLHRTDAMLTPSRPLPLRLDFGTNFAISASDTCLLIAGKGGIFRDCLDDGAPAVVVDYVELETNGISVVSDLCETAHSEIFVLETISGSVFRISVPVR